MFHFFGYRKNLDKMGGQYHAFPSKIICITVPKISVRGNHLVFHYFRVSKKFG